MKDMNEADGAPWIGKISCRFTGAFMVLTPQRPLFHRIDWGCSEDVTCGQFVSSIRWLNRAAHGARGWPLGRPRRQGAS